MNKNNDVLFKLGIGLQLILIPIALLYRFSSDAYRYNLIIGVCAVLVILLSFWPQAIVIRAKRFRAIKMQFLLVISVLSISWLAYGFLFNYVRNNCTPAYKINMVDNGYSQPSFTKSDLGKNCDFSPSASGVATSRVESGILPWFLVMNPGIGLVTASAMSAAFLLLPVANLYRYSLDKKRIKGIKKTDLFA